MRRCSATPSGTASIWPPALGRSGGAGFAEPRCPLDLEGIRRAGRCAGRGLSCARPRTRGADRCLVAQPAGMDADAIRRRQGRTHSGHHQSRLPPERARIRPSAVGCAAIVTATAFKTSQLHGNAEYAAAGTRQGRSGQAARGTTCRQLRAVIQIGGPACPGTIPFEEVSTDPGGPRHREAAGCAGQDAAVRRCRQHPVYQRLRRATMHGWQRPRAIKPSRSIW